jgi:predicted kinase
MPAVSEIYVLMSGPPGSGKSTLAAAIASSLDLPLFSKDTIKEALLDSLGAGSVDDSQRLGGAAIRALIAVAIENGRGVVDSTWQRGRAIEELRAFTAPIVIVRSVISRR